MGKKLEKAWLPLGILIGYVILAMFLRPIYYLNDDVTIRSILSGAYTGTPDGHGVYMEYPLTGILALLYQVSPGTSWYDLFLSGSLLYCIYAMAETIQTKSIWRKLLMVLIGTVLFWDTLWYVHYTIVAAALVGTGIYLWLNRQNKIPSVIVFLLGYMVRRQVFLLGMPFLLVAILFQMVVRPGKVESAEDSAEKNKSTGKKRVTELKNSIIGLGAMGLGVFACVGLRFVMYGEPQWKEYEAFNDTRTELYDYTSFVSMTEEDPAIAALQLDPNIQKVLVSYDTMLDQRISGELMANVTSAVPDTKMGYPDAFRRYLEHLRYDRYPLMLAVLAGYVILIAYLIRQRKRKALIPVGCLLAGRSFIWVYLIAAGRFPERIVLSLCMIEVLLLLGMLVRVWTFGEKMSEDSVKEITKEMAKGATGKATNETASKHLQGKISLSQIVALAVLAMFFIWNVVFTADRMKTQKIFQSQWDVLKDYCNIRDDNLYLLDVYPVVAYAERLYEEDSYNTMLLGGWLTGSPLTYERLNNKVLGVNDAADAMYYSDKVYFITDSDLSVGVDADWLEAYFSERYGKVRLQQLDTVSCGQDKTFVVYGLKR